MQKSDLQGWSKTLLGQKRRKRRSFSSLKSKESRMTKAFFMSKRWIRVLETDPNLAKNYSGSGSSQPKMIQIRIRNTGDMNAGITAGGNGEEGECAST